MTNKKLPKRITNAYLDKQIDQDSHWKELIFVMFRYYVKFFMPDIYDKIDFSKEVEALDKELSKLFRNYYANGKRIGDRLLKVKLLDGTDKYLFIHIEVQSTYEKNFEKRLYSMYYRLCDKYGFNVEMVAFLTDTNKSFRPNTFVSTTFQTEIVFKFRCIKLIDYNLDALLQSDNPIALASAAHLLMLKTRKEKPEPRLQYKKHLIRLLLQRNYGRQFIEAMFMFISNILALPLEYEEKFEEETTHLLNIQEDMKLTLENSRLVDVYLWKGEKIGIEKGIEKGIERGKKYNSVKVAIKMLKANKDTAEIIEFTELSENELNMVKAYYKQFGEECINHLNFNGKELSVL